MNWKDEPKVGDFCLLWCDNDISVSSHGTVTFIDPLYERYCNDEGGYDNAATITNPELSEAAAHEYATSAPLGSYLDQKAAFLAGVEYMKKQLTT